MESHGKQSSSESPKKANTPYWRLGLLSAMSNPELMVLEDDLVVLIRDAYPKANHHYLVCPKKKIDSIKEVTAADLSLLKHMADAGKKVSGDHKNFEFQMGYHTEPSLLRLHLHIISTDFDSPCLKKKEHWNSFTTKFFLHSSNVIEELERNGKINFMSHDEATELLKTPLKCHKCSFVPKNMPALKVHLKTHLKLS